MRYLLALTLLACGGSPFVPVTFEMTDTYGYFDVTAEATKRLNPECVMNCELATAIEDGGCERLELHPDGGASCAPGGGLYLPFLGLADLSQPSADAGPVISHTRNIAPGSDIRVGDFALFRGYPACSGTVRINGPTTIRVVRADACTITSR